MSAFQCVRGPAFAGLAAITLALSTNSAAAQGRHADTVYPSVEAIDAYPNRNAGGFGRLFDLRTPSVAGRKGNPSGLLPHPSPRYDLLKLGSEMVPKPDDNKPDEESEMPAGYVFLGQFIDHDLTLDTVTGFDRLAVRGELENARTPELDLDCVYGGGPERTPFLYDNGGPYLRVGAPLVKGADGAPIRYDLFRIAPAGALMSDDGGPTALIGDPRNDENFVVSQMQAAFIAYHNRIVDRLLEEELEEFKNLARKFSKPSDVATNARSDAQKLLAIYTYAPTETATKSGKATIDPDSITRDEFFKEVVTNSAQVKSELLEQARDIVIHQYHRMIIEDFLPRIIGINRVLDILENGRDFYFKDGFVDEDGRSAEPFIPIEFAVAAYRFGHSQVPGTLTIREGDGTGVKVGLFDPRLGFTRMRAGKDSNVVIDWTYLVDIPDQATGANTRFARALKLDTELSSPLGDLVTANVVGAGGLGNLAQRNLTRGRTYRLPSGQDLACLMLGKLHKRGALDKIYRVEGELKPEEQFACIGENGKEEPYSAFVLAADPDTAATLALRRTPLWYYILQEASVFGGPFDKKAAAAKQNGEKALSSESANDKTAVFSLTLGATPARATEKSQEADAIAQAKLAKEAGMVTRNASGPSGAAKVGATLGPVGATIVGETLIGLIDHYREKNGKGLDLNSALPPGQQAMKRPAASEPATPGLTVTRVVIDGKPFGDRYLLSNFLYDAGVAGAINESNVCVGDASQPTDPC
jgi:Animal haem peroxidase